MARATNEMNVSRCVALCRVSGACYAVLSGTLSQSVSQPVSTPAVRQRGNTHQRRTAVSEGTKERSNEATKQRSNERSTNRRPLTHSLTQFH